MAFFNGHETALPLYENFEQQLFELFPDACKKVQKTQIAFSNKHVFACASFLRVRRKADLPSPYFVVTLGLSYPLESKRVAAKVEPYSGRWTTHIIIADTTDIDDELLSWLGDAYAFAATK
ncbi:MAG: DUF5655 domain-containing protein [Slackia sp.]|nr:DUF5655 domain-containing protein [Slackia sp.]